MGGKGGGRIGRCGLHAHKQGGEADKGGCRGAGIGAPGARHVGEHVVVRALEGDAPLFVVADFFWSKHANIFARARSEPYHTHSTWRIYVSRVHMSHWGPSRTLLTASDTGVHTLVTPKS